MLLRLKEIMSYTSQIPSAPKIEYFENKPEDIIKTWLINVPRFLKENRGSHHQKFIYEVRNEHH